MLLSDIEPKLYSAIQTALFDIFAYRLGPDEWEVAEEYFRQSLQNAIASQQAVKVDRPNGCECKQPLYDTQSICMRCSCIKPPAT